MLHSRVNPVAILAAFAKTCVLALVMGKASVLVITSFSFSKLQEYDKRNRLKTKNDYFLMLPVVIDVIKCI